MSEFKKKEKNLDILRAYSKQFLFSIHLTYQADFSKSRGKTGKRKGKFSIATRGLSKRDGEASFTGSVSLKMRS
jgi:hypothetical protein